MKESNGIDKSNRNRKKKNNKIEKLLHTLCTKLDCVSIHEPIKIVFIVWICGQCAKIKNNF